MDGYRKCLYTSDGILFIYEKEENPAIYSSICELWGYMVGEISQIEKSKSSMVSFICGVKKNISNS